MANKRRARGEGKIETVTRKDGTLRHRLVKTVGGRKTLGPWVKKRSDAVPMFKSRQSRRSDSQSPSFATESLLLLSSLQVSPTNMEQYRMTLEFFAQTSLGELPTMAVQASDVREALKTHGGSQTTLRGHQTRICAVLKKLGNRLEMANPKPPRKRKVSDADTDGFIAHALTLPELECLLLLVPRLLGLRRSEALGLRHSDREDDGVWIQRTVTVTKEAVHERDVMKTSRSWAWQWLPEVLQGMIGPPRQGYVLTGTDKPMNPNTATSRTRRLLKGTKWEGYTPQPLRRSFGQAHYEEGRDVYGTAAVMRHSVQMSEQEYLQTDKDLRRRLMQKGTAKGTVKRETMENQVQNDK